MDESSPEAPPEGELWRMGANGRMAWSPTAKDVAVGDRSSGRLLVMRPPGKITRTYESGKPVHSVAFNATATAVAFASGRELAVWDFSKGDSLKTCDVHDLPILGLSPHSDGDLMLSIAGEPGSPREIAVWDRTTGRAIARREFGSSVRASAVSTDWRRLLCLERDGSLVSYDTATGSKALVITNAADLDDPPLAALSPCGTLAATLSRRNHSAILWKLPPMPPAMKPR